MPAVSFYRLSELLSEDERFNLYQLLRLTPTNAGQIELRRLQEDELEELES